MTEIMRTTIATLREFVGALRASYHADIKGRTVRDISRDVTLEQRVRESQSRLDYLVPLYKAMNSAVQQAGTGAAGGVKAYTTQFQKLGKLIRDEVDYHHEKFFGGEIRRLQILVPVEGVPVENWLAVTLDEIIAQVQQQVADERNAARQRARNAEQARKAFLASLNDEQRALLRHALDAAQTKGMHAISVDIRDLEA
jgi:hypothetical protein